MLVAGLAALAVLAGPPHEIKARHLRPRPGAVARGTTVRDSALLGARARMPWPGARRCATRR